MLHFTAVGYNLISEVLNHFTEYPYEKGHFRNVHEQYSAEIGVAVQRKKGERVCGDYTRYYKTEEGVLYVILSDGIGSGESARKYSETAVSLTEKLLGLIPKPLLVIFLVNQWIALQQSENFGCATIDLLEIDLHTGTANFYKCGASCSYLLTHHSLSDIEGNSNLIGCIDSNFTVQQHLEKLSEDTVIIMSSDGAELSKEDLPTTNTVLSDKSMRICAKKLLVASGQDGLDDKTVIALRLHKRI